MRGEVSLPLEPARAQPGHVTGRARGCPEALPRDFGLGVRLGFPPHKLPGGEKQRVPIARARERSGGDPRRRADGQPRLEDRREIARLHLRIATEEARGVVIVGHDARVTDVADRVLWLEDGAFRSISDMATDPLCGIAVGRQRTPHVVHDARPGTSARPSVGRSPNGGGGRVGH